MPSRFIVNGIAVNSCFTTTNDYDLLKSQIASNTVAIKDNSIYVDRVTGRKFKIVVSNGEIHLMPLSLNKILFIGNSYTEHGNSENVWWGSGRGMAASVDETQYTSIIGSATGAEIIKGNYVHFELAYSPNYDFEGNISINDSDFDLIVVQLFENAKFTDSMQESWESLYDFLHRKCPQASIVQLVGWYEENKFNAVSRAAAKKGVTLVNCTDDVSKGRYSLGDYVTGSDGNYHSIKNDGVAYHPSDVGFYGIAKKLLALYDVDLNYLYSIDIHQGHDASISTPYESWVKGGVVNVRVTSGIVNNISVNDSNGNQITVTKRDTSHFTFIMPDSDVIVSVIE